MSKLKLRREQINKHIAQLRAIFPALSKKTDTEIEGALYHAERRAHHAAERLCDDSFYSLEKYERDIAPVRAELHRFLGLAECQIRVLVENEPRGFAIKISDEDVHAYRLNVRRDWGGYGIIWPDFDDT